MAFIPASAEEQGQVATWLLHTADDAGIDRKLIKTVRKGFDVPEALLPFLGEVTPPIAESGKTAPEGWYETELPKVDVALDGDTGKVVLTEDAVVAELAEGTVVENPDATDAEVEASRVESQELAKHDIEAERAAELAAREVLPLAVDKNQDGEVDREVIRAWAKENGLNPAASGALKKSVIEQYHAAH